MKKLTRMESTKEARRVLNRHSVDLSYCQFSCYGHEVRLTGWLCRTDGLDFTGAQIEGIIHDFRKSLPGFMVAGDTDNWHFTSEHISFIGDKESRNTGGAGSAPEEQTTYEIDLDDFDFEAS